MSNEQLESRPEVVDASKILLDAMWKHVGNGWQTPYEKLIAELQAFVTRAEEMKP